MLYAIIAMLLFVLFMLSRYHHALTVRAASTRYDAALSGAREAAKRSRAEAEAALLHAIETDNLQTLKQAVTEFGVAAGNASTVLQQARQRRNVLAADAHKKAREQRIARHRVQKREEAAQRAACEQAAAALAPRLEPASGTVVQTVADPSQARVQGPNRVRGRLLEIFSMIRVGRAFRTTRGEPSSASVEQVVEGGVKGPRGRSGGHPRGRPRG